MAKRKVSPACGNCFYGTATGEDPLTGIDKVICRRYPEHKRFDANRWCGDYLDEITGGDLILKPEEKS